jgi:hypothetical protein
LNGIQNTIAYRENEFVLWFTPEKSPSRTGCLNLISERIQKQAEISTFRQIENSRILLQNLLIVPAPNVLQRLVIYQLPA